MYRPYSFGFRNRANPANRGQQTCKMCARNEYCTYNRRGNHSDCFVAVKVQEERRWRCRDCKNRDICGLYGKSNDPNCYEIVQKK